MQEVSEKKLNNQLTVEDHQKAERYALSLSKLTSPVTYGNDVQEQLEALSQGLLNNVSSKDMGELGSSLRDLVFQLKNPVETDGKAKGFINHLIPKMWRKTKQSIFEVQSKYESATQQIDSVADELKRGVVKANNRNELLLKQYEGFQKYYHEVAIVIEGADLRIKELDQQIDKLNTIINNDPEAHPEEVLKVKQLTSQRLGVVKRRHDLFLSQQTILQQAPMVLMIRENNNRQIQQVQTTLTTAVPVWKSNAMLAVSLLEQRKLGMVLDATREYTDTLIENTANLTKDSVESASKRDTEGFVDVQTLIKGRETISQTLKDVMQNNKEIERNMQNAEKELKSSEGLLNGTKSDAQSSIE